jgi:two-component system, cell cycle sensor histidine kinase and response regulator CckA
VQLCCDDTAAALIFLARHMAEQRKATILIVEDEPLMLRVLKSVFEGAAFGVLTARDGREAVALYEQRHADIDVILSDIALPRMDGWMVYSQLKALNPKVKVIFTSGYFDPQIRAQCEAEGILDLIPKPFKLDEVVEIVRSRVGLR